MNNLWLGCLLGLILLASLIASYPLRKHGCINYKAALLFIIVVSVAYWQWGSLPAYRNYLLSEQRKHDAQVMLASLSNQEDLVQRLKDHLKLHPNSAKGFYLLGRLYASQNNLVAAKQAFNKAYKLAPNDLLVQINYVQSQAHQDGQLNVNLRNVLKNILKNDPKQPDALAMLAIDAYRRHKNSLAIDYWQRLLVLVPAQSADGIAIRKAIAQAFKDSTI